MNIETVPKFRELVKRVQTNMLTMKIYLMMIFSSTEIIMGTNRIGGNTWRIK